MTNIRTIIVDDEAPARRRMKKLLALVRNIELVAEAENGEEAIVMINEKKPDLLLLDIQLKDMTGFDVLKSLSPELNIVIIFITAYDTYAIQAFEANAIDYLLKPYLDERFSKAIQKSIKLIEADRPSSLKELVRRIDALEALEDIVKVKEGKVIHHFNLQDLVFIKSEGYYCNVHLVNLERPKVIRNSLKGIYRKLPNYFIRINKSTIINTKKISATKLFKKTIEIEMLTGAVFMAYKNFSEELEKLFH